MRPEGFYPLSTGCALQKINQEPQNENSLNHACDATPPAVNPAPARTQVAPPQNRQPAAPASQRTLEDAFTELRQGRLSQDGARLSTVAVKLLMKESEAQQDWLALERYAIGNFHFSQRYIYTVCPILWFYFS